jgi:glycosyltransferase involved in cell wall biosynthesis
LRGKRACTPETTKRVRLKIVHIGDSDRGGGAAHAMSRLHQALRGLGVDSHVLVRTSAAPGNAALTVATRGDADDLFPAVRDAVVRQYVELNRTASTNTHFSLHIDGADLSRVPLVASAQIVHLHWTGSFQAPSDVRALFDAKPVVWTLHDLEPLTGGCHFPVDCARYAGDCAGCPQLLHDPFRITATTLRDKKTLWAGGRPTFVAPSRYMAECARRSAVAQRAEASVVTIPHGIDVETFCPRPKAAARRALGVPADGLYVLCGSNYNAEMRKGLRFVDRILAGARARSQTDPSQLRLLTVGDPKLDLHDRGGVIQLGRVAVDLMPWVYAAADIILHPSLEDNFPCMLLESLSCGTPAVAFDIGGVADIVEDETCGLLTAAGDEPAMTAALSSLVRDPERLQRMSEHARARAVAHFDAASIARRHVELYDEIASQRAVSVARTGPPPKSELDGIFPSWSTACLVQESRAKSEHIAALVGESRAKSEHIVDLAAESRARSEHIAALAEESSAKSKRIGGLERDAAALAQSLADQRRQVEEKEAELAAIHDVAEQRRALAEELHASAARVEAMASTLQGAVHERDELLEKFKATIDEQRVEIELVHRAANDRQQLIDDLQQVAEDRLAVIDRLAASAGSAAASSP